MSVNHYRIEGPAAINFSGGRSSAFMLKNILDAHDGSLPSDVFPVFCNTGKELPETLNFVQKCQNEWNVKIYWLEYRYNKNAQGTANDPKNTYEVVSHNSASRHGEPFSALITQKRYLPNAVTRICTDELKINTVRRFMLHEHGFTSKQYSNVIGIRHDERSRWKNMMDNSRECNQKHKRIIPMVMMGHTKKDIDDFWKNNDFDLTIESFKGNCDLCFLKGKNTIIRIMTENNDLANWWIQQENSQNDGVRLFRHKHSYKDLLEEAQRQPQKTLFTHAEEQGFDCFCTD